MNFLTVTLHSHKNVVSLPSPPKEGWTVWWSGYRYFTKGREVFDEPGPMNPPIIARTVLRNMVTLPLAGV
jgi:hypothetical protein